MKARRKTKAERHATRSSSRDTGPRSYGRGRRGSSAAAGGRKKLGRTKAGQTRATRKPALANAGERRATCNGQRCRDCPLQCCGTCAYAGKVRDGRKTLFICVNRPDAPGLMRKVPSGSVCRNFRPRKTRGGQRRSKSPPDEARYVALTFDRFAIVDASDYKSLSRFKWTACRCGQKFYARRNDKGAGVWMHREIMQPPKGMVVDHTNGNGLDNSRDNQRVCTQMENGHNSRPHGRSSNFKGVSYNEILKLWQAGICINRLTKLIGYFDEEIEAARAYDREAYRRFGEFAWLNFPEEAKTWKRESVEA